jgi:hypothetical protein
MHALRFVLEGEGVTTVVEGKPCRMLPGDMIITPGTTWHEHIHEGQGRCVWVDALDVPLHRYLRDPVFEPGPAHELLALPADDSFAAAGLMTPRSCRPTPYSPMFRYAWAQAEGGTGRVAGRTRRLAPPALCQSAAWRRSDADTGLLPARARAAADLSAATKQIAIRYAWWCRAPAGRWWVTSASIGRARIFSRCRTTDGGPLRHQ